MTDDPNLDDSWEKGLRLAFSKLTAGRLSETWKEPSPAESALPEPGPAQALPPPTPGVSAVARSKERP